jgi:hypothetical protein
VLIDLVGGSGAAAGVGGSGLSSEEGHVTSMLL